MTEVQAGSTYKFPRTFTQEEFDRFAALSGDDNPIHVDPEFASRTRFGRTVAHGMLLYSALSGYLHVLFPGPGAFQVSQQMTFHSPTYVGEQVIFEIMVSPEYSGTGLVELITQVVRPNQEIGLKGKCLIWSADKVQRPEEFQKSPYDHANLPKHTYKGMQVGQSAQLGRTFTRSDLNEYSSVSGDANPLFSDQEFVTEAGLSGIPIPGGLLGGMYSCLLGTQLPGRGTNWLKQSLYFPAPAYMDEEITARVEVTRIRPEKDLVNLRTSCTNPAGELVCDGEALVYVKDLE